MKLTEALTPTGIPQSICGKFYVRDFRVSTRST